MKCYRRILRIRWEQKTTIEEVFSRVRCQKNMVQQIIERRLNLFGHICRMKDNKLVKEVMFGMMEGETRRKTMQRMVGRHQGRVWRRNPQTQQEGARLRHVDGENGIGHLWALSPRSNGWLDIETEDRQQNLC